MKQILRKTGLIRPLLLMCLLFLGGSSLTWAETVTYMFNSKSWTAKIVSDNPVDANWTSGKDGASIQSGRGIQVTTSASGANGTSPTSFENITKIVVTYSTNASSGAGSIAVKVGSGTAKSQSVTTTGGTTNRSLTYDFSPSETGAVNVSVTCTTNSIYIYSVAITTASVDDTYTVTYDANGGTGTMTDSNSPYNSGATVTVLGNAFTRNSYTFTGWNTAADGSGTDYAADATFTITANTTLYAQWEEESSGSGETITFDFEDESAHRTDNNNSYGANSYSENGATISLTYADAITSGAPLAGSANVMGRVAKNTTNSPVILIGAIDISSKRITSIAYKTKGVSAMSQVLEYSLDIVFNANFCNN